MLHAKKFLSQKFFVLPFQSSKNFRAPLFAMKIMGQPHKKHVNSIFIEKFVVIFSGPGAPYKGQKF